jgi:hypothetical protein
MGISRRRATVSVVAAKTLLPVVWLLQQPPFERYVLRRMWGPDAMNLIESARKLHAQARAGDVASGITPTRSSG